MTAVPDRLDALGVLLWTWGASALPRLAIAIVVLIAGAQIAKWAARATVGAIAETGRLDETTRPVFAAAARYAVLVLTFVIALTQLGVQTGSLLAAVGAAGLAIGLALQGTLSNIAAGVMLLWLRPFRAGDYIEIVSGTAFAGTVREIGLFASLLETYDGLFVFAPNSTIWSFALRNHTHNVGRLVCFSVSLDAGADIDRARKVLVTIVSGLPGVMANPPPDIFVDAINAGAPSLACRFWARHEAVGEVQRQVLERARRGLEEADASLRPTHVARLVPPETDPSRLRA